MLESHSTQTQVFFCEYYEIFKNSFLNIEHLRWLLLKIEPANNLRSSFVERREAVITNMQRHICYIKCEEPVRPALCNLFVIDINNSMSL